MERESPREKSSVLEGCDFFRNTACAYFPCHPGVSPGEFNCLFCYCPLYALGEGCGGDLSYTDKGIKNCAACAFPHERESYRLVLARLGAVAQLAKKTDE